MLGKLYDEQRGRKPRRKGFLVACTSVYSAFWHEKGCNSPIISYRYRHHHRFYDPRHHYHYRYYYYYYYYYYLLFITYFLLFIT